MSTLSKTARNAMQRIGRASGRKSPQFHRDTTGKYYLPDGKEIQGAGLWELMDKGVFVPQEDGLFPGMTQTFKFNPQCLAL